MKVLFDYCSQDRAYGDSYGQALIMLEDGDNAEEIIKKYTKPRNFLDQTYSRPQRITHFEKPNGFGKMISYEGDLILFQTHQPYLD